MNVTPAVKQLLEYYVSDNPGTKAKLTQLLMAGKLSGTGKLLVLAVDQGFEHGPLAVFSNNVAAYDPHYHFSLAIEAGLSAYAAPLGMLEAGAHHFAGQIPLILKLNNSNLLLDNNQAPNQAITASVKDALRLGCTAVGFTIYPGSDNSLEMFEELREITYEAKASGLAVIVWSYARGGIVPKSGETAFDVIAYATHIAALLGAHIIKVKLPTQDIVLNNSHNLNIPPLAELKARVVGIKQTTFNGKRLIIFSGGTQKSSDELYQEVRAIKDGGGDGSIIGRNIFQRSKAEALSLLDNIIKIYQG